MHSYCCQRWSVCIVVATGRWSYYFQLVSTRRYPREGIWSGRDVIYWFLTVANLLLMQRRKVRTTVLLFFGDKIPHLESVFLEIGLQSLIRILHASLVQIDTEMTKKYCNQHYAVAVSTNTQMSNTARYSCRIAFLVYLTCIWRIR